MATWGGEGGGGEMMGGEGGEEGGRGEGGGSEEGRWEGGQDKITLSRLDGSLCPAPLSRHLK